MIPPNSTLKTYFKTHKLSSSSPSPSSPLVAGKMADSGAGHPIIPEAVLGATSKIAAHLEELKRHLHAYLELAQPDALAALPPLERAGVLIVLARATSTLLSLRLKCTGVRPEEHAVNAELERLKLYEQKLERFNDLNKAPIKPSTTLNRQAAARFIEHSLPNLTPEQKRSMRGNLRGGNRDCLDKRSGQNKRKWRSSDRKSIHEAAQEFLMKASQELLGPQGNLVKGPLGKCDSDGDDELVE